MARKNESRKKKPAVPTETSESIAQQTADFLQAGGKVELIKRGASGQESFKGKKHITYAKRK